MRLWKEYMKENGRNFTLIRQPTFHKLIRVGLRQYLAPIAVEGALEAFGVYWTAEGVVDGNTVPVVAALAVHRTFQDTLRLRAG